MTYWSKLKKSVPDRFRTQPWLLIALCAAVAMSGAGCAQLAYYAQATQGQFGVMSSAKPIDTWLADPNTSADLKQRLLRAQEIRRFAVNELGLPNNGSYTRFADLKRPYVLWNVIATPELSMKPVQWCFPVAGCVDYRGYYQKAQAQGFATELRTQGYDVRVSGVPAYSTLGWFDDPILSTFIAYPEAEVARMLFHELAHQVAYAPGDTPFNEAFATTVEGIGVQRWLDLHGNDQIRERYRVFQQRKCEFVMLLSAHRKQLEAIYAGNHTDDEKRARKAMIISSLQHSYRTLKHDQWGGYSGYDIWFDEPITNAHFVLVATYEELVPAFQALFAQSGSLPKFYDNVRALAKQDKAERMRRLAKLLPVPSPVVPGQPAPTPLDRGGADPIVASVTAAMQ